MARTKQAARKTGDTGGRNIMPVTQEEKQLQAAVKKGPMRAEIKYLQKRYDKDGNAFTAEQKEISQPVEMTEWWENFALTITHQLDYNNQRVVATSLSINSAGLKDMLKTIIGNFPGQSYMTKNVTVPFPPRSLFHYRHEIKEASNAFADATIERHHSELMVDFINDHFKEELEEGQNLLDQGLTTYPHLWIHFRPGSLIYSRLRGQDRVFMLRSYEYVCGMCAGLQLSVTYIDYDGEQFGWCDTVLVIPAFAGAEAMLHLNAYPFEMHPTHAAVRKALVARGRKFERLAGQHVQEHKGIAVSSGCRPSRYNVEGRVMIDCKTSTRLDANTAFEVRPLDGQDGSASRPAKPRRMHDSKSEDESLASTTRHLPDLDEEHCLLANAAVRGFCFTSKAFLEFFVDQLCDVAWNEKCFDQLVLPQSQKDLVQALVATHTTQGKDGFDDLIKGKGRGLVLVLHGPPGVGKTLTAECVAEYSRRPLYTVSSGDLGTHSEALDARLSRIMDMASTWKTVLLIDEADVFLEECSSTDVERNSLVSIFLRTLEYYQGIIFLTTNRVSTFDEAFKSRIHVPLKYSSLDKASRRQIWKTLLDKTDCHVSVHQKGYDALSERDLNGRQIKNIVRTAGSLAKFNSRKLDIAQLEQVIDIQMQFEHDLSAPHGLNTPTSD